MSATPSSVAQQDALSALSSHLHTEQEFCPVCEQPVTNERMRELRGRLTLRDQTQSAEISARLQSVFAREKAQALEEVRRNAEAVLAQERAQTVAQIAAARDEGRVNAEREAQQRIATAELINQDLQQRIAQADADTSQAAELVTALQSQLMASQADKEAAIQSLKTEMAANESTIRAEALATANAAADAHIVERDRIHAESTAALQLHVAEIEEARLASVETNKELAVQVDQLRRDKDAAVEAAKQEAQAREIVIRDEAVKSTRAESQEKVTAAEEAKVQAEAKASTVELQLRTLQETHEAQTTERLLEQREILEKATVDAVNVEKATSFGERQKLITQVDDLRRQLEKKTSEELGEGAEVDLFETLKMEFPTDRIERLGRGKQGADLLHVVVHNGIDCGTLIYDSKNHGAWRNEFVSKLAVDQMAAKADHAILSTRAFPAGTKHLDVKDGVILANPARVAALVHIVRQHVINTHSLKVSGEARTSKTEALYAFITSERCRALMSRIDTHAEDLQDLLVKDKRAHDLMWRKQGELICSVQRVRAELCGEIDMLIGTAPVIEERGDE